ncbi:MAG TPA: PIN domain-containing protein [Thermoanaerobaculia bacterium]|nr:PIN domain-containing protein [Thermoanaerobaculia bacterium]
MGAQRARAVVLDAGALIAFERGDRRMVLLLETIRRGDERLIVPAGVLAQVWRDGARQARLAALVADHRTEVDPLDESAAKATGVLCGISRTRDIVDASVAVSARFAEDAVVVSGDVDDLRRIDPGLVLHAL